jgi:MFS transporter, DHA2 family, multidrug resistance protein
LFLPFAVAQLVFAPRSAAMVKRFGAKAVATTGLSLVTLSLIGFIWVDAGTPIWALCGLFFIQGAGMANIMPPAMESIMSSLPREKAGVGSAVSNTVRQVASALGIAVLGSVLASVYQSQVSPATASLPGPARDAAESSLSGAYGVAEKLGAAGQAIIAPANDAFVSAMHWAAAIGAVVVALGIFAALRWLPGHAQVAPLAPDEVGESQLAEAASGH